MEKNETNETSVTMHPLIKELEEAHGKACLRLIERCILNQNYIMINASTNGQQTARINLFKNL